MSLFTHRGGHLDTYDADGNKTGTLYYGEGLDKPCSECKVLPNVRCITASGKPLGKIHKARS